MYVIVFKNFKYKIITGKVVVGSLSTWQTLQNIVAECTNKH
jgi:hypothetical protein